MGSEMCIRDSRMVFGQPRQEDLLAHLVDSVSPERLEELRPLLRIDLRPEAVGMGGMGATDHNLTTREWVPLITTSQPGWVPPRMGATDHNLTTRMGATDQW